MLLSIKFLHVVPFRQQIWPPRAILVYDWLMLKKSSPLKVLDQRKPNLVWIITKVSRFKIVSRDAVQQPTWPLLLKIEHMVKLKVCLTFISYSFWNIRRKVLTFYKFDEKRAITPRWVFRFTSKLQGRSILLCWSCLYLFLMIGISINDVTLFYLIKNIVNHVKILLRTNN
jgi:hypothetical protein